MASFDLILLSCLILAISQVQAQTTPAPGPAGPINLTAILEKNGQYTTFIRLLNLTQVGNQIENQLNSSGHQGFTVLAPTDNAFSNLKAGTLNDLTVQELVALALYHILPKYYSMTSLQIVSNPVINQATSEDGGQYGLNFTSSANQVNVSTGLVDTQLNNALRQDFPLAVYQLDKVLFPLDMFGPKTPKPSPTPLASPAKKAPSSAAKGPSTAETPLASPAKKKKAPSAAKRPSTVETPLASPAKNGPSSAAKGPSTADALGSNTSLGWGLVIGMCLICNSLL